jgi:FtsP/CotA-like multicopper oxidase with cupredoxin domain
MARILSLLLLFVGIGLMFAMPPKKALLAIRRTSQLGTAAAAASRNQLGTLSANNTRCELQSSPAAPTTTLASPRTPAATDIAPPPRAKKQKDAQRKAEERAKQTPAKTSERLRKMREYTANTLAGNYTLASPTIVHCQQYHTASHS